MSEVKVVCVTCTKYSGLIPGFYHFLDEYWPDRPWPVEIVTGKNRPWFEGIPHALWLYGHDRGWATNMLAYLDQCSARWIVLLLDDYYLSGVADTGRLQSIVATMQQDATVGYVNLRPWSDDVLYQTEVLFGSWTLWQKVQDRVILGEYDKATAQYLLSLQPGIWERQALSSLLRAGEDGWQVEIEGTRRARDTTERMMGVLGDFPLPYMNIARYGEYRDGSREWLVGKLGAEHDIVAQLDAMLRERIM